MTVEIPCSASPEPAVLVFGDKGRRVPIVAGVVVATSLAAFLSFYHIGARPFWYDEGVSLGMARLPWDEVVKAAPSQPNMWFYYVLLREWLHLGDTEGFVRALSAVFAVATVPVIFLLGRRIFGAAAGLCAGLLLAVNADFIKYAQEARSYALQTFLLTLLCYVLCRCIEKPTDSRWIVYVIVGTLALYSQFFSVFMLVAHASAILLFPSPHAKLRRGFISSVLLIAILSSPMIFYALKIPASTLLWIPHTSLRLVYLLFKQMTGNVGPVTVVMYLLATIGGVLSILKSGRTWSDETLRAQRIVVAISFFVPVALLLGTSVFRPTLVFRYFLMGMPAMVLLSAAGLASIARRWMLISVLVVWVAVGGIGTLRYYQRDLELHLDNYPELARFIAENARPDDAVVFYFASMKVPYEYYLNRTSTPHGRPVVIYPGALPTSADIDGHFSPSFFNTRPYQRIWLVEHEQAIINRDENLDAVRHILNCKYRYASSFTSPAWMILLYSHQPNSAGAPYVDDSKWATKPCRPPR